MKTKRKCWEIQTIEMHDRRKFELKVNTFLEDNTKHFINVSFAKSQDGYIAFILYEREKEIIDL